MRILVVEDDDVIAAQLRRTLGKEGYEVDVAHDGDRGFAMASSGAYSVILLDWMLPGRSGIDVCKSLREYGMTRPILMLTAKREVDDRVEGLDAGADDYLPKPFEFQELLARIRALVRRTKSNKVTQFKVEDLEIDTRSRMVRRGGEELKLTPREYDLLEALARNRGRTLTREVIINQIWGDDSSVSNTVNFHVNSLRKKVDGGREPGLIETVHGFGYRLRAEAD